MYIFSYILEKIKKNREYYASSKIHPVTGARIFPDGRSYSTTYRFGSYLVYNANNQVWPLHRHVAELFVPNPDNKPVVNHKDGNKLNPRADNLEWSTYQENTLHAYSTGLMKANRLTRKDVVEIRSYRDEGGDLTKLSAKYGVKHMTIFNIISNKTWKGVK